METGVVFLVLSDNIRFRSKDASWLKIKNESCKVSSSYVILKLIIALHGVLVSQEFVNIIHLAKCHVTGQLSHANLIIWILSQDPSPLQLDPHCCDILYQLLDKLVDLI